VTARFPCKYVHDLYTTVESIASVEYVYSSPHLTALLASCNADPRLF